MEQELKNLLARVLDMNETELRACLITILNLTYEARLPTQTKNIIIQAIDGTYNPLRRTGIKI